MFTREDYAEYFKVIERKEAQMVHFLHHVILQLKDGPMLADLKKMLDDEVRHAQMVKRLHERLPED